MKKCDRTWKWPLESGNGSSEHQNIKQRSTLCWGHVYVWSLFNDLGFYYAQDISMILPFKKSWQCNGWSSPTPCDSTMKRLKKQDCSIALFSNLKMIVCVGKITTVGEQKFQGQQTSRDNSVVLPKQSAAGCSVHGDNICFKTQVSGTLNRSSCQKLQPFRAFLWNLNFPSLSFGKLKMYFLFLGPRLYSYTHLTI